MNYVLLQSALLAYPAIDPVIVSVGPLDIRWYGAAYVAGILLGWLYARALVRNRRLWGSRPAPLARSDLDDFIVWAAIGIVLGGRVGYILFYDLAPVLAHPIRAIEIWRGGMSFHGGLAGVTIAMVLFARSRGIGVWRLADIISACAPIGLFFGRIANFINGELWGRETDVPWAMIFPGAGPLPRHPSQIYEAGLEGLVLFAVLRLLTYHSVSLALPGLTTGAFLTGYALTRMFAEFFRQPDVQLGFLFEGWLTMGMVLSAPMFLAGLFLLLRARLLRQRQSETEPTTGGQGA
ncbi:MAG: prolipoprotein diacylglyceryl transferase [Ahrensia sp.]|nr:prolipoprotein diacylglyceryl transferase [Ahrensia sp.]